MVRKFSIVSMSGCLWTCARILLLASPDILLSTMLPHMVLLIPDFERVVLYISKASRTERELSPSKKGIIVLISSVLMFAWCFDNPRFVTSFMSSAILVFKTVLCCDAWQNFLILVENLPPRKLLEQAWLSSLRAFVSFSCIDDALLYIFLIRIWNTLSSSPFSGLQFSSSFLTSMKGFIFCRRLSRCT